MKQGRITIRDIQLSLKAKGDKKILFRPVGKFGFVEYSEESLEKAFESLLVKIRLAISGIEKLSPHERLLLDLFMLHADHRAPLRAVANNLKEG